MAGWTNSKVFSACITSALNNTKGFNLLSDALIEAIRRRVDQINATGGKEFSELPALQVLAIQDRPLTGYQTLFDGCLSGEERVHRLTRMLRSDPQ